MFTSCIKRGGGGTLASALSVAALLLGLGFSNNAAAVLVVTAKAAVGPALSDNTLDKDQVISITIILDNGAIVTDTTTGVITPIKGKFKTGTQILVRLATTDGLNPIPGTFAFVPGPLASGCESDPLSALGTCTFDGSNVVTITLNQDINMTEGQTNLIAGSFKVQAVQPVTVNPAGSFITSALTNFGDFLGCFPSPDPGVWANCDFPGSGTGSSGGTFPALCDVRVDKQISCDGGMTWVDVGLENANEDLSNGCTALTTDQILVRYQVANVGNIAAVGCVLDESNPNFGNPTDPGTIGAGQTINISMGASTPPLCGTAVGTEENPLEPNTATLTCASCERSFIPPTPGVLTAFDKATFSCQVAELKTDRAVSCDQRATYADVGVGDTQPQASPWPDGSLVGANEDGTNGCTTLVGNPVNWAYQACNTGTATLYNCNLVDSNSSVIGGTPFSIGTLNAGACATGLPMPGPVSCSADLQSSEATHGTVTLSCCTKPVPAGSACSDVGQVVQAFDSSNVTCQTVGLDVTKDCTVNPDTNAATFTVTATNTGQVALNNCTSTDTLYVGNLCPVSGDPTGTPQLQTLTPASFNLAVGGVQTLTGGVTLTANSCNTVSVSCTDALTGSTVRGTARDSCSFTPPPPPNECLTRTPGFWGNHPFLIQSSDPRSLNLLQDFYVCGTQINTVAALSTRSTTEAICSVGTDSKVPVPGYPNGLGPQLTQLVRQCTAAYLNVAASAKLGGSCDAVMDIQQTLNNCCDATSACTGQPTAGYSVNDCIGLLDAFNNSPDTLNFPYTTGPADSSICRASKNTGTVVYPNQGAAP